MSVKRISAMAAVCGAALGLTLGAGAALASGGGSGGGGGGGGPSDSAPAYDPVQEYARGTALLKDGKFRDADKAFAHVLVSAPKDSDTLFFMGMAKVGENDLKGAQKYYEKALKVDPEMTTAQVELALTNVKLGQADKAKAGLDALKARADACAGSCPKAGELKAALTTVDAAVNPPAGGAPAAASPAGSAALESPSLLFADAGHGDHAYVQAVSLINQGRYDDALDALHKAQIAFGPHPDVLTYIGYTYRKLGKYDVAEGYYRQALSIAPNHRGATEYYGELKVERGDLAGAKQMLAKLTAMCTFGCVEEDTLRRWIDAGREPQG